MLFLFPCLPCGQKYLFTFNILNPPRTVCYNYSVSEVLYPCFLQPRSPETLLFSINFSFRKKPRGSQEQTEVCTVHDAAARFVERTCSFICQITLHLRLSFHAPHGDHKKDLQCLSFRSGIMQVLFFVFCFIRFIKIRFWLMSSANGIRCLFSANRKCWSGVWTDSWTAGQHSSPVFAVCQVIVHDSY